MPHFLTILETPTERLLAYLARAIWLRQHGSRVRGTLEGKTLCCLFEKPSLRTRVSFEQAMRRLGGTAMSLSQNEVGLNSREAPEDVSRVLSGMVDGIMARVGTHQTVERLAKASSVPVVNGLSDRAHPAQALADMLTLIDEFAPGEPDGLRAQGRTLAFVGDANNVARSAAVACARLGVRFIICSPRGYMLDEAWLSEVKSAVPGAAIEQARSPREAVASADAIYCDTFVSMGQETERAHRLAAFEGFQVNGALLAEAPRHAIVMHCLPAHRGEEITDEAMDGPRSRVFPQAHNRLHAQMGLLAELLGA